MPDLLKEGIALVPTPGESPAAAVAGAVLFGGVFLLFMGFKECSGGSTNGMDRGVRKIGLGIVATLVGAGIAATSQLSSAKKAEPAG